MTFDNLVNFRDVAIGPMKTGLLYRSEELVRLSPADVDRLHDYHLKLIIDLRSPAKHKKKPGRAKTRTVNVPILEQGSYLQVPGFLFTRNGGESFREFCRGYYHHMAFEQTSRFGEAITLLAQADHLPALFHCRAGKDRTGVLAALIQLLMGIPYDEVKEHYLRTNEHFRPKLDKLVRFTPAPQRVRLMLTARAEYLDVVYDKIVSDYQNVETYLREACGVSDATLATMRARLL